VSAPAPTLPADLSPVPGLDALAASSEAAVPSIPAPSLRPPTPAAPASSFAPEPVVEPALKVKAPTIFEVSDAGPEPKETVKVGGSEWDDPLFHVSVAPPPATMSPAPVVRATDSAKAGWADPVFNSIPPSAASAEAAATPSIPSHGVTTAQIPVTVDVARAKPRGVPMGAFVLAAGLAVLGIAGGIALSRPKPSPPMPRAAAHAPVDPTPPPAPVPAALQDPVAAPTPPTEGPVAPPDMAFAAPTNDPGGHHPRSEHSPRRPAATPESQSETQRRLEIALGIRGGAAIPNGPIPVQPPSRTIPSAPNVPSGPAASNTPPPSAARSLVRMREVGNAIERSGVVRRCWEQFKLRNPAATRRSLSIGWSVSEVGAVTLRVSDHSEPTLANCIERGSRDVRNLGAGPASSDSTRVDLD